MDTIIELWWVWILLEICWVYFIIGFMDKGYIKNEDAINKIYIVVAGVGILLMGLNMFSISILTFRFIIK